MKAALAAIVLLLAGLFTVEVTKMRKDASLVPPEISASSEPAETDLGVRTIPLKHLDTTQHDRLLGLITALRLPVKIASDPVRNVLIVRGTPYGCALAEAVVKDIDQPVPPEPDYSARVRIVDMGTYEEGVEDKMQVPEDLMDVQGPLTALAKALGEGTLVLKLLDDVRDLGKPKDYLGGDRRTLTSVGYYRLEVVPDGDRVGVSIYLDRENASQRWVFLLPRSGGTGVAYSDTIFPAACVITLAPEEPPGK